MYSKVQWSVFVFCDSCRTCTIFSAVKKVLETECGGQEFICHSNSTMLQKLSKCEVKAAHCGNFTICLPLRFCMKSNFGNSKGH